MRDTFKQALAAKLGKRLYLWSAHDEHVFDGVRRGRKAGERGSGVTTKPLEEEARLLFRQMPTKKMGNLPSVGYYFEGCEYVFVDSDAKARRMPGVSSACLTVLGKSENCWARLLGR